MSELIPRAPAVFIGHGSPMNALAQNPYTAAWRALGAAVPRPRALLAVSAHWYTRGSLVTANERPPTIHDFGGFPKPLYEVSYPAPGSPALARRVVELLGPQARAADDWGLDHGTWSVLVHMYPAADLPVVQLSIDATQPAAYHYDVGRRLATLREEGILILGSGGVVHNLARADWGQTGAPPPGWARDFDERVRAQVEAGEDLPLLGYEQLGDGGRLAVPTPEHYLPLLYVLGARFPGERAASFAVGFDLGTISMTSFGLGVAVQQ